MRSVYMMKASHDLYKIGIAKDVDSRLKSHQTSNGSKILLVTHAKCGNALKLESQVHALLKEHVQPGGREWFKLTPEQAIKVCIYIHQQAEIYHSEDDIKMMIDEFSGIHEQLVASRKEIEELTQQIGNDIYKSVGRLQRYKPTPKPPKIKPQPKLNTDSWLLGQAIDVVRAEKKASTSLLQRKLKIGYGRAARVIENLERQGIIGPADGSRPRTVLTQ